MSGNDPISKVSDAALNIVVDKLANLFGTLWDYSLGLVLNIICLCWKADEVAEEMKRLQELQDELENRAGAEARRNQEVVADRLSRWTRRVSSLANVASNFQKSYEDGSTCICRICLGYDTVNLLRQARKLAEEGNVFSGGAPLLMRPRGPDPVGQVPSRTSSSTLAGGRDASRQVEDHIMDDGVGITAASSGSRTIEIMVGDTLYELAEKYGVSIGDIKRKNRLTGDTIFAGKNLVIPSPR